MSKADDHAIAAVTAALLRRGKMLHYASLLILFLSPFLLVTKGTSGLPSLAVVVALGLLQFWFAFRVSLDADLFEGLAGDKTDTAGMDKALARLGLVKPDQSGRSMEDRAKGGIRLLKLQALCLLGQILAFLACFLIH